jgi:protein gp37
VFVNSMSDLFHDDVSDWFIAEVFGVMAETPQHTYQILTKRPGRMRAYLRDDPQHILEDLRDKRLAQAVYDAMYPLPNVWLGVSAEDQKWANVRIPPLLNTPAAVRFVSAEPLLGPVTLDPLWGHGAFGPGLDWVIVGGESGPGARPMELEWATRLVADCRELGIAPFVKQLGSAFGPHKGGDMDTWPPELRVREYPAVTS